MRALQLQATGSLALTDLPDPVPGAGDILIRVEAAGICGTDRHLYHGEFPSNPPVTLGHEFSGLVISGNLPAGTRVTCDPNIPCGTCPQCRRGRVNLCDANIAIGLHRDGGLAEFATMPLHRAHILPADLNPLHGAFCEPLACTLHGIDLGAPRPGERVAVLGGGVIGLLAVQLARLAGAEVMLVTRQRAKRDLGLAVGASLTAATLDEVLTLWPQGADLVLECAGVTDTVEGAPHVTRTGGRIVLLGVLPKGQRVQIDPFDLLFREISLIPSFLNPFTHARATAMIAAGVIRVDPLISRVIGLDEAADAIANPPRAGEVRVIVQP
ncbi:MAG: zinc-dependent alcohol dehydrogenase family protein [Candidatus Saccharibacteria bacterium]|nr:zinc-dependent alcohol dehydrogenase family protein [Pseudorhodobacter sp.]